MRYKSKITEDVNVSKLKYGGYKMGTTHTGRRFRKNTIVAKPNGKFSGTVFYEEQTSATGDWGDGVETKRYTNEITVAEVAANEDRALVERRTKLILDALNNDEPYELDAV